MPTRQFNIYSSNYQLSPSHLIGFSTSVNTLTASIHRKTTPTRLINACVFHALQASCPILNLVLGPLNLNLLGLQVDLNQVVLDITAVPGAGNLLGNLLCSVAGLLDGPLGGLLGAGGLLSNLLNNITGLLGGLLGGIGK